MITMIKKTIYCSVFLFVILEVLSVSKTYANIPMATAALTVTNSIRLDGRLDEPAWRHAKVIHLTQQDPHPGMPSPFQTTVRVLTDGDHLYFGIVCMDRDPKAIAVHTLQRDGIQTDDDHITIVLDPFGKGRLGYWFQVNADGARTDGLDADDKSNTDWDGIWNAKTRRTRAGWIAEISISTSSMEFPSSKKDWMFNVERYVPRKQLTLRWSGITLDSDIFDLHRAGLLYGLNGLKQSHDLDVQPYILGRYNNASGNNASVAVGADIKYGFTPEMEGILTINPDFAEAEAEKGQINLTRFPIFFPEKRPFFLEGSNLFKFGYALNLGNDSNLSTQFVPYFSRRIGLVNGAITPIDMGAKLVGHAGPFSIGALGIETGNGGGTSSKELAVVRSTYDMNNNLRIGTLLTHGDPTGLTNNNFIGMDGIWHTSQFDGSKNLTMSGWIGHSNDNLQSGPANGYGGAIAYLNDLWLVRFKANNFDRALYTALGYLPRPGTRQYLGTIVYRPRPSGDSFNWVRQFNIGETYIQVDDLDGVPQSKILMVVPLGIKTQSGFSMQPEFDTEYESLSAPFNISSNVTIPVGKYQFNTVSISWSSPKSYPLVATGSISNGNYYTGRLKTENAALNWSSSNGHFQLGINNQNDYGYLPQGSFILRLTQLDATWSFSPDLTITSYTQYDNIKRKVGENLRIAWIIKPGRNLYIVFNHGIEPQLASINGTSPTGNALIGKFRWNLSL